MDGLQHRLIALLQVVRQQEHVVAGLHRQQGGLAGLVVLGDGAHAQGVGDDDARIAQLLPQQIRDQGGGEGGGQAVACELRRGDVAHHHKGDPLLRRVPEGDQLRIQQLLPGPVRDGVALVGILRRGPVAGEVLVAGEDALALQPLRQRPVQGGDGGRIRAEGTAADHGVVPVGQHVRHRGEVHVEAQLRQIAADGAADLPGSLRVRHLGHVFNGRDVELPAAADPGHGASLLVHAEEDRQAGTVQADLLHVPAEVLGLGLVFQILSHVDQAPHRDAVIGVPGGVARQGHGAGDTG